MKTILVVDDEPGIVRLVRDYLEHGGFTVLTASDGEAALRAARTIKPDLVVLDLGLPGLDGLDVTRALRREGPVPIIMLTARADESDKLIGLELGADDYLTKPFSPKELVARVRTVLRRTEGLQGPPEMIRTGDVEIDTTRFSVTVGGRRVDLTPTEFQLLATMARQPGRVFTRAQLLDAVHGVAVESYERAIDAHVKNLRRKLEPDPRAPRYLLTAFGVGYRFEGGEAGGRAAPGPPWGESPPHLQTHRCHPPGEAGGAHPGGPRERPGRPGGAHRPSCSCSRSSWRSSSCTSSTRPSPPASGSSSRGARWPGMPRWRRWGPGW